MSVLVLGIGNLVMTDDGVGVRVVQCLASHYVFPAGVTVLDGGTLGLDLLPFLEGLEHLLIIDAMVTGGPPGTIARLTGDDIPIAFETKLSPHQMGLKDLLAVSLLQGNTPPDTVLLGVQPESIQMGLDLSPSVEAQLQTLVEMSLRELEAWGIIPDSWQK
ncbi:MAG: HyaD/HybD family hydrogenase maturation endopeptidase [Geobacter sp.]|nr:MAG: HyaD/HybD family hydrogenase maturation endopeptidase [Geobacter sp.]